MPELPEVETVVRTLEKQIQDAKIIDIDIRYGRIIDNVSEAEFKNVLLNASFKQFLRRGKYLHFEMDNGYSFYAHLRMEGKFYIYDEYDKTINKHIHVVFHLADGRFLCYHDTRKFGRFYISKNDVVPPNIAKLGYEPFDEKFTPSVVYQLLQASKKDLKNFLLDQEQICGLGNIYVNEVCFLLKVYPAIPTKDLDEEDAKKLHKYIKDVLSNAIKAGGTTIRSYTSSLGVSGLFQLQVLVHDKEGEPCINCQTPIKKIMLHQRGTYFCPVCQLRGAPQ